METRSAANFSPINDLERAMHAAYKGDLSQAALLNRFLESQVVVLINREMPEDGWDESVSVLTLKNPTGQPVLAVFTTLERAAPWVAPGSPYHFAVHTDFSWLVQKIEPDIGLAVNPGSPMGFEVRPQGVEQLQTDSHHQLN